MRGWIFALLCVSALPVYADDWRAEITPLKAGKFPAPRPLTATYRFGWGAISAAEAQIVFARPKPGQLELNFNTKTIGPVRALWQMDATHVARCASATLRPISFLQVEKYRRETERTQADFTPEQVMHLDEREPPGETPSKLRRFKFPNAFDLQSALLMVRSQRLAAGDRYVLVVYPARSSYLAKVDVVGRESIKVAGKNFDAIKCKIGLARITKEFELEPHEKFKSAFAWLSDDKDRLLLKIESEVFVGSVWMEMQSVKFTES